MLSTECVLEKERGITISPLYGMVDKSKLRLEPVSHEHLNWVFDLETYGTATNSIVPEISAVAFDLSTGEPYHELTMHLDIDSQVALGRVVSAGTLTFWMTQQDDARRKMLLADPKYCKDMGYPAPLGIKDAMEYLHERIRTVSEQWSWGIKGRSREPLVWGNGITFDLGKTISLFETAGVPLPWQFWAERDARTLMDLAPGIKKAFADDFRGIPHYGLDDCKHELRYLSATYIKIQELSAL